MAPVHDTDVEVDRWEKAAWTNYELLEKLEARQARKRRAMIAATMVLFLTLTAIPVIDQQSSQWLSRWAQLQLAVAINDLKLRAIQEGSPHRIRLLPDQGLDYLVESVDRCDALEGKWIQQTGIRSLRWIPGKLRWFFPTDAKSGEFEALGDVICYDPYRGAFAGRWPGKASGNFIPALKVPGIPLGLAGLGAIDHGVARAPEPPQRDTEQDSTDHLTVLFIEGASGVVSIH